MPLFQPWRLALPCFFLAVLSLSCSSPGAHADRDLPKPAVDVPAGKAGEVRTAVFAIGCFWCSEAVYDQLDGVTSVVSGFAGGSKDTANYEQVCSGSTGHAESVKVTYDPSKISYANLLRVYFTIFDPTTLNAQGPDHGTQYRSAIFFESDDEKRVAEAYIKQLTDAKIFDEPIVTTLEPLTAEKNFYPAEDYHQHFVQLHPDHPYVQQCSLPEIRHVLEKLPDLVKHKSK